MVKGNVAVRTLFGGYSSSSSSKKKVTKGATLIRVDTPAELPNPNHKRGLSDAERSLATMRISNTTAGPDALKRYTSGTIHEEEEDEPSNIVEETETNENNELISKEHKSSETIPLERMESNMSWKMSGRDSFRMMSAPTPPVSLLRVNSTISTKSHLSDASSFAPQPLKRENSTVSRHSVRSRPLPLQSVDSNVIDAVRLRNTSSASKPNLLQAPPLTRQESRSHALLLKGRMNSSLSRNSVAVTRSSHHHDFDPEIMKYESSDGESTTASPEQDAILPTTPSSAISASDEDGAGESEQLRVEVLERSDLKRPVYLVSSATQFWSNMVSVAPSKKKEVKSDDVYLTKVEI
jgi:hypothetical protein